MTGGETKPGAIIPPEAAPLRTMTVTMAVMCYLACLAVGALLIIDRAVSAWTGDLSREATVQIRELKDVDLAGEVNAAMTLLQHTAGIIDATLLNEGESAKLLEPWLGTTDLEGLPVPRLIRLTIDDTHPPDFTALEGQLKATVKGASLDTHQRWQVEMTRMARALSSLSFAVLALIGLSAVAMVIFATRTVLDANRHVVDVLHLIGARNSYIARQIDRRFISAGLLAGFIGVGLGLLTFMVLGLSGTVGTGGIADAARALLFGDWRIVLWNYVAFLAIPAVATLISLITARLALVRMLEAKP